MFSSWPGSGNYMFGPSHVSAAPAPTHPLSVPFARGAFGVIVADYQEISIPYEDVEFAIEYFVQNAGRAGMATLAFRKGLAAVIDDKHIPFLVRTLYQQTPQELLEFGFEVLWFARKFPTSTMKALKRMVAELLVIASQTEDKIEIQNIYDLIKQLCMKRLNFYSYPSLNLEFGCAAVVQLASMLMEGKIILDEPDNNPIDIFFSADDDNRIKRILQALYLIDRLEQAEQGYKGDYTARHCPDAADWATMLALKGALQNLLTVATATLSSSEGDTSVWPEKVALCYSFYALTKKDEQYGSQFGYHVSQELPGTLVALCREHVGLRKRTLSPTYTYPTELIPAVHSDQLQKLNSLLQLDSSDATIAAAEEFCKKHAIAIEATNYDAAAQDAFNQLGAGGIEPELSGYFNGLATQPINIFNYLITVKKLPLEKTLSKFRDFPHLRERGIRIYKSHYQLADYIAPGPYFLSDEEVQRFLLIIKCTPMSVINNIFFEERPWSPRSMSAQAFNLLVTALLTRENMDREWLKDYCLDVLPTWPLTAAVHLSRMLVRNEILLFEDDRSPLHMFFSDDELRIKRAMQALYLLDQITMDDNETLELKRVVHSILSGFSVAPEEASVAHWLPKVIACYPFYVLFRKEFSLLYRKEAVGSLDKGYFTKRISDLCKDSAERANAAVKPSTPSPHWASKFQPATISASSASVESQLSAAHQPPM